MEEATVKTYKPRYYNPKDKGSIYEFCHSLRGFLKEPKEKRPRHCASLYWVRSRNRPTA